MNGPIHAVVAFGADGNGNDSALGKKLAKRSPNRRERIAQEILMAPVTVEDKKARQRLHVKRSYYRKLTTLTSLREQVQQLEREYARTLLQHEQRLALSTMPHDEHVASFAQVARIKDLLRIENDRLREAVMEHSAFQVKLERFLNEDQIGTPMAECDGDSSQPRPHPASTPLESTSDDCERLLSIAPYSKEECMAVAKMLYQEMQQFLRHNEFLTTGASVFGWSDRRRIVDDQFHFSVKKIFAGITPLELSLRSWRMHCDASKYERVYSRSLNNKVFKAQDVDENNVLMYRMMPDPKSQIIGESLFLVTRFQTHNGFIVSFRSLDEHRVLNSPARASGAKTVWVTMFSWLIFEEGGEFGENTTVDFGGIVPQSLVAKAQIWMLEVLLMSLRWEHMVIGPVVTLCC